MRRNRITLPLLVAVIVSLVAVQVSAQRVRSVLPTPASRAVVNGPGVDFTPCLFFLSLSEAQRLQIQQIVDAEKPAINALTATLRADHNALEALAQATPADACAIGSAYLKEVADRKALETELRTLRTKVEAVLTPDQKLRLDGCIDAISNFGGPRP